MRERVHATESSYSMGCRCLECKAAHARYNGNRVKERERNHILIEESRVMHINRMLELAERIAK